MGLKNTLIGLIKRTYVDKDPNNGHLPKSIFKQLKKGIEVRVQLARPSNRKGEFQTGFLVYDAQRHGTGPNSQPSYLTDYYGPSDYFEIEDIKNSRLPSYCINVSDLDSITILGTCAREIYRRQK